MRASFSAASFAAASVSKYAGQDTIHQRQEAEAVYLVGCLGALAWLSSQTLGVQPLGSAGARQYQIPRRS